MPLAVLKATAQVRNAPPTRMIQPRAHVAAAQPAGQHHGDAAHQRRADQPSGLPAQAGLDQPREPGGAAEHRAGAPATAARAAAAVPPGPPAWPTSRPRPL